MKGDILTKDEIISIVSMKTYWDEVKARDDPTVDNDIILMSELNMLVAKLGPKVLNIVGEYATEVQEE